MTSMADITGAAAGAALEAVSEGDTITLAVDGKRYGGWTSTDIERSLDCMTNKFTLAYVDRWLDRTLPWAIRDGAKAQVHYGKHLLLTGYVNCATWEVEGSKWDLSSAGRSLSGDLEDCSAVHASGFWKSKSPLSIINELTADYNILFQSTVPEALKPLPRFLLQEGEDIKDVIDRLCEMVAVLPVSQPNGSVSLIRADKPIGKVLELPVGSAISRKVVLDDQNRHDTYYCVGQSWGNKNRSGKAVCEIRTQVADAGVKRHRPLILLANHSVAQLAQLKARSTWERNIRAGRAMRYSCVFIGILGPDGLPWSLGTHVSADDEAMGIKDTMVICGANIRSSASELVTEVEMTLPQAYSTLTYPLKVKGLNPQPRIKRPPDVCFPFDTPGLPSGGIPGSGFE